MDDGAGLPTSAYELCAITCACVCMCSNMLFVFILSCRCIFVLVLLNYYSHGYSSQLNIIFIIINSLCS